MQGEKQMKCKKCGAEFEGKFCTECGAPAAVNSTSLPSREQGTADKKSKCKQKTKKKKPIYKRWWFYVVIIAAVLIAALSLSGKDRGEKIDWSKIEMHDMLPEPKSNVGHIYSNSESGISVDFYKTSEDEYKDYVSECKNLGFTVDSESSSNSYEAYNTDGYKLNVSWYDKKLSVKLDAPMQFTEIQWPSSSVGKALPTPESNKGKFSYEYDDSFYLYVGNTSPNDYAKYVKKCSDGGFNIDYSKGDTYYRAKNKEGYSLSLAYEGFNIMSISISSPSEASDGDKSINIVPTETTTKSKKDGKADSGNKVGLRKNFKEAMDSYEAFIDEYVAFMEKYKDSDGTDPSMLTDYAKYVSKYTEMAENFSKWEDEDMNAAETAYYIEVQARVSKKLIAIT